MTYPCFDWVDYYLNAIADAVRKGVKVEIVVSNVNSGCFDKYGSGWTPDDIAVQIVKRVIGRKGIDHNFEQKIKERLCVTYIRRGRKEGKSEAARWSGPCMEVLQDPGGKPTARWPCEKPIANHVKLILVDDECYYLGSQNLYMCDLAEWGAIVVDRDETHRLCEDYWRPMWKQSWVQGKDWGDCNYSKVIKGCKVRTSYCYGLVPSCNGVVELQPLVSHAETDV